MSDRYVKDGGTFAAYSRGVPLVTASGGTETTTGGYKYHTFLTSGTFTLTSADSDALLECLLVGGGGGASANGGGGGGGAVVLANLPIAAGAYTMTRGAGGTGGSGAPTNGGTSSIYLANTFTAQAPGGGYGGYQTQNLPYNSTTVPFGCGGGAGYSSGASYTPTYNNGNWGIAGNRGGANNGTGQTAQGGGGGAGGQGAASVGNNGGNGGAGLTIWSNALGLGVFGGGGGGGANTGGTRGTGANGGDGQGAGGTPAATAGTANTGNGGGGGYTGGGGSAGAAGGTGIVVVRYRVA